MQVIHIEEIVLTTHTAGFQIENIYLKLRTGKSL